MTHIKDKMKHFALIIKAGLFSLLLFSTALADSLEIKINQDAIALPYWPNHLNYYGAVIIARGGADNYCPPLILNFADYLSHNGWSVVLLSHAQDHIIPWDKQLPETIRLLREQKNHRIVLVHYGEGLSDSLAYFSGPQSKMINGFVMVSAYDDEKGGLENLPHVRFPLFDIAGQFDYEAVLSQMASREKEFRQRHYTALKMPGAHHDYEYNEKLLLAFIHGWMVKLPELRHEPVPILVSYIAPLFSSPSQHVKLEESSWKGFIDNPVEPDW